MVAAWRRRSPAVIAVLSAAMIALMFPAAHPAAASANGATRQAVQLRGMLPRAASHAAGDNYGWATAISGNDAVIGAPGVSRSAGAAYFFARSNGRWHRQAVIHDPGAAGGDLFGYAVAVSGATAVIGAWGTRNHDGAAYVYSRSGTSWHHQATLADPGPGGDIFGYSVAISGATVIIGSFSGNHGSGAAYAFVHSAGGWHQQAKLVGPSGSSAFGASVALSDGTAVVGAWATNGEAGTASVFVRSGSRWRRQATLADPHFFREHFGSSVGISGSVAVVGAPLRRAQAGASYIFIRSRGRWRLRGILTDPVAHVKDHFGWSVAVSKTGSGTRVLVGAPATASACGAAYEFVRSGTSWRKRATVVEPRCAAQDQVGLSVAISGRQALIGAPGEKNYAGNVFVLRLP